MTRVAAKQIIIEITGIPNSLSISGSLIISGGVLDLSDTTSIIGLPILLPGGVISGSIQVDHNVTTNYTASHHFLQSDIIALGTVVGGDVSAILPSGTTSGSIQINHDATTNYDAQEHFTSASITEFGTIVNGDITAILPAGTTSGSIQVDHDATANYNTQEHFTSASITEFGTIVTGDVLAILPLGSISGSGQLPTGTISGSVQVNHNVTTNFELDEHIAHSAVSLSLAGTTNEIEIAGSDGNIATSKAWTIGLPDNVTISDGLTVINTITASGGYFSGNLNVGGVLTALEFHTTFVSSSIIYQSGSTKFGDTLDDIHERTGSMYISGSIVATETPLVSGSIQIDHNTTTNYSSSRHFLQNEITSLGTVIVGDVTVILPSATVSGSIQIDHDVTTNFDAQKHFTSASITEFGTVVTGDVSAILPGGSISGSSQLPSGTVSGSIQVDHDATTNFDAQKHFTSASITEFGTIVTGDVSAILPLGSISGSDQLPAGTVSGSIQVDHDAASNYVSDEHFLQTEITTLSTITAGNVNAILPLGTISGSSQLPAGSVSGSIQIDHNTATNYSSSRHFLQSDITTLGTVVVGDVSTILPAGSVSGSIQVDHDITTNFVEDEHIAHSGVELTISGTINEIEITGGAQNIAASRTWTIGLPDDVTITDSITISGSLLRSVVNDDIDSGSLETIATLNTGSYSAAFFDYYIVSGSNQRAGTVMSTWQSDGTITHTDMSTEDLGDTNGVILTVDISGPDARLRMDADNDNWLIKTFVRGI